MAGGGLLGRIMRSPELMAALGFGAGGALLSDDEDKLGNGVAGAALGLAAGRGARGLLRRVPAPDAMLSQAEKVQKMLELRRALGQQGSQATQFPNRSAMDAVDALAESHAQQKYGERIGENGIDRAINGIDEIGRLGSRVWDGVDAVADRAMPTDRIRDVKNFMGDNAGTLTGLGILGGVGGVGYLLARAPEDSKDVNVREQAMAAVGMENTPTGIKMFQAQAGLPLTGQWDDATIAAIAKIIAAKQGGGQDEGPPAPSLAPHNQR